jgi:hypothetical protein
MKPDNITLLAGLIVGAFIVERLWNGESIDSFEPAVRLGIGCIFMTLLGTSYQLERLFGDEKA